MTLSVWTFLELQKRRILFCFLHWNWLCTSRCYCRIEVKNIYFYKLKVLVKIKKDVVVMMV